MLKAGAAQIDISPKDSQFLFGYPHVERYSTGIHDKLWSSALYISNEDEQVMFIANDIIFISKNVAKNARNEISAKTGINAANIMITATHTHSAPHVLDYISNESDPVIPKADQQYVKFMQDAIIEAGCEAYRKAQPANIGFATADDTGVGTNRRDPEGPADHEVPVLIAKNLADEYIGCMLVCSMHPTVMHEDSTLISGDFPGLSRLYLQENILGTDCPVLHHTGPSGNQSPRHVTKANTFDEAKRLGEILGKSIEKVLPGIEYKYSIELQCKSAFINELPKKSFPDVEQAQQNLKAAVDRLQNLTDTNAPRQQVRTAECDWFGAEETLTLAKAYKDGRTAKACDRCMPVEIQAICLDKMVFVGWPGECFIEYALQVKNNLPNTFVISLANGEMQGYIVTKEAAQEGGYEASNALISYEAGDIFVNQTLQLIKEIGE